MEQGSLAPPACPHVADDGITTLYVPVDGNTVLADICFVHGLMGHPRRTWQYGKSANHQQPSSSSQPTETSIRHRLKQSFKREKKNLSNSCYWPFDLLRRDFPDVRVLTYGYDSHPTHFYKHKTNQMTISQHAQTLLAKITNERASCRGRPIIFVAHSLGGILVKDALIESLKYEQQPSLKDISQSCHAIIFFGTPHLGASVAEYGEMIATLVGCLPGGFSISKNILTGLKPDGEKLSAVNRDFNDILNRDTKAEEKIQICSFQEGQPLTSVKLFDGKVVPDTSSFFNRRDIESNYSVLANHMEICRFRSAEHSTYRAVRAALTDYLNVIRAKRARALDESNIAGQKQEREQHEALLNIVDFGERLLRQQQLEKTSTTESSFDWVWDSSFSLWLQNDQPLFWIGGHPASGKSTLINYLVKSPKTCELLQYHAHGDWKLLYFFFDFRAGTGISNNMEGLLRSILAQLLKEFPDLTKHLKTVFGFMDQLPRLMKEFNAVHGSPPNRLPSSQHQIPLHTFSVQQLHQAIKTCLASLYKPICIFLDGLDEFQGEKVELLRFIKSLGPYASPTLTALKICVASRPDPPFPDAFADCPSFKMQEMNKPGIRSYTFEMLRIVLSNPQTYVQDDLIRLVDEVVEASRGVFLWVRFAVNELIDGIGLGEEIGSTALQKRLDKLPSDLHDIYARIFDRMADDARGVTALILLLTTSAIEPLNMSVLQGALTVASECVPTTFAVSLNWFKTQFDIQKQSVFRKALLTTTGGLVEALDTKVRIPGGYSIIDWYNIQAVRTIHKTVDTYLELRGLYKLIGESYIPALGHELWIKIYGIYWTNQYRSKHLATVENEFAHYPKDQEYLRLFTGGSKFTTEWKTNSQNAFLLQTMKNLPIHAQQFEAVTTSSSRELMEPILSSSYWRWHRMCSRTRLESMTCACSIFDAIGNGIFLDNLGSDSIAFAIMHDLNWMVNDYLEIQQQQQWYQSAATNISGLWFTINQILSKGTAISKPPKRFLNLKNFCVALNIFTDDVTAVSLAMFLKYHPYVEIEEIMASIMYANFVVIRLLFSVRPKGTVILVFKDDLHFLQLDVWKGLPFNTLKIGSCYTTLWFLAARIAHNFKRFGELREASIDEAEDILDMLLDNAEDLNEVCGPSGNILCSYIGLFMHERYPVYSKLFVEILVQKGIDLHAEGPEGNAVDIAWRFANICPIYEEDSSYIDYNRSPFTAYTSATRHLISLGALPVRADPNGLIPSVEHMLLYSEMKDDHFFIRRCRRFYRKPSVGDSAIYPEPEHYPNSLNARHRNRSLQRLPTESTESIYNTESEEVNEESDEGTNMGLIRC